MKFIELNESELSSVSGGNLSNVKDSFLCGMKKPFENAWKVVTLNSSDNEKGQLLSTATWVAIGFFAPWLYSKAVQVKNKILG